MKILTLGPLWFPVSRNTLGGREALIAHLVLALEKLGCHMTLIANGDARTTAELLPVVPESLVKQIEAGTAWDYLYYEQSQLQLALQQGAEFDVIHSHIGPGAYVLSAVPGIQTRVLHTLHTPVYEDLEWFVRQYPHLWFSTVSEFQARKLWQQGATHCHVIPNGIQVEDFTFQPHGGKGLFFIGRIERQKGPDLAVQVAKTLDYPLLLAGPLIEQDFFDRTIKPYLNDRIQYIGVVDHLQKDTLFGQAGCVIIPSRWDEPFGLVAIEAMACGTPVVSLSHGAFPEIIESGLTGYLGQDEGELADLVMRAMHLERATIRARVATRFDIAVVAQKYYQLYEQMATSV